MDRSCHAVASGAMQPWSKVSAAGLSWEKFKELCAKHGRPSSSGSAGEGVSGGSSCGGGIAAVENEECANPAGRCYAAPFSIWRLNVVPLQSMLC